jgi:hypothetical protein
MKKAIYNAELSELSALTSEIVGGSDRSIGSGDMCAQKYLVGIPGGLA